ncbi:hypothetical protein LEP1GSC127_2099 [Leptospira kirschneri str. 200801925]|nr:hypothetical protein LEP1GSC127_2099 [Leptospira kirschneri str. 200801925]
MEEKKRKLEMVLSQEKLKAVLKDTMDTFKELIDKQTRMSLKYSIQMFLINSVIF